MNIIKIRQEERLKKIGIIKNWAKKLKGKEYSRLVLQVMSACEVARRTANEYIEIALFELGLKRKDFK